MHMVRYFEIWLGVDNIYVYEYTNIHPLNILGGLALLANKRKQL